MTEIYKKERNYFISEDWFGNKDVNIQGTCWPCTYNTCEDEIFNTICYDNCFNIQALYNNSTIEYLEYVIKNSNLAYSNIVENNKYKVDDLIKQGLIYVEEDKIKFNFVLLTKSQYELLNSTFEFNEDLKEIKEERIKIINKLEKEIIKFLPSYLSVDAEYLANNYFYAYVRPIVVKCFEEALLIKPNNNDKRFNFNMYAWTFD